MTIGIDKYITNSDETMSDTMTTQTTYPARALLKRPDKPPEIISISFPFVMSSDNSDLIKEIAPVIDADKVDHVDYSSTIVIFYASDRSRPYNFNISYQSFFGNVLFLKCKRHHSLLTGTMPVSLSNIEIRRICAAMGWKRPEERE